MNHKRICLCLRLFGALACLMMAGESLGIGRKEFFERLQESWNNIQTFQSDVIQESRYSDGIVQRFAGKLALAEDGRIAYDYDLTGEYKDDSIAAPKEGAAPKSEPKASPRPPSSIPSGSYRAQGNLVVQYNPEQNVLIEGPEDESLLIQVFRSMLGSGNFDVEKFKEEYKIHAIEDQTLPDGTAVHRLVATPKKGSEVYKWISQTGNDQIEWQQELWVEQSTMRPLKAVLLSDKESTMIQLKNSRLNQPIDEKNFLIPVKEGQVPPKYQKGSMVDRNQTVQKEFQGVPLEDIEVEDKN